MADWDAIVVGGGIGGSAATLRAVQYGLRAVWILGDRRTAKASRSRYVKNLDNMVGQSGSLVARLGAEAIAEDFPGAAEALRRRHIHVGTQDLILDTRARVQEDYGAQVEIVEARAARAARKPDGFLVETEKETFLAPHLVLATGVMDRQPLLKGPRGGEPRAHWIYPYANQETVLYCIRCEGHLTRGVPTAVIGAGEAAAQVSLMLRERYDTEVVLLTHGENPSWSSESAALLDAYEVVSRDAEIQEVLGQPKEGELGGFLLEGGEEIRVRLALVAMGLHRVYNDLAVELGADLEESGLRQDQRHVLVDENGETSVPNLFCVGDMAAGREARIRKQVYTAQEYAVRALDRIDARRRREQRREHLD